jgi:hypothetical protein
MNTVRVAEVLLVDIGKLSDLSGKINIHPGSRMAGCRFKKPRKSAI